MTELPIVVSDDVVTVGGYTNQVELQLSVGATGERGSRIFTGSVPPASLPTGSPEWGGYTDFKVGDVYLLRDTGVLEVWEWLYASTEYTWVKTVDDIGGAGGTVILDADLDAIADLTGTGLARRTAPNTWVLDTTSYLTSNQLITLTGDVTGSGTTSISTTVADDSHSHTGATISSLDAGDVTTGTFNIARIPTGSTGTTVALGNHTHSYQPIDGDLTAIAAISGTGYLRRTGVDTWTLDTPATATWGGITGTLSSQTDLQNALNAKQNSDADLTAIAALAGTSGFLKKTAADTWALDTSTYLTGNQSITLSGDATGSGTTAITVVVVDDSHSHTGSTISALDASDTTTGTFNIARIPTGTTGTTVALGNHTHSYQPADNDLTAIAALTGTGYLQRTGVDTWALGAGGTGDVVGPASATADALVVYNGTTGKLIKNSNLVINSGSITAPSTDLNITSSTGGVYISASTGYFTSIGSRLEVWTDSSTDDFISGIYAESTKWLIDQYGTFRTGGRLRIGHIDDGPVIQSGSTSPKYGYLNLSAPTGSLHVSTNATHGYGHGVWFQSGTTSSDWQPLVRVDNTNVYGYGEIAVFSNGQGGSQIEATGLHYNENTESNLYSLYSWGSLSLQAPYDTGGGWDSRGSIYTGPLKISGVYAEYNRIQVYDNPPGDSGAVVFSVDRYGYIDSPTITTINGTIDKNKALAIMGYY